MSYGSFGRILTLTGLAALAGAQVAVAQTQSNPLVLDGLVITASPTPRALAAVAQHVTILDGRELEARGIAAFADALRGVPGVDVVRGGSFGAVTSVFLRGGESDYTLVLVDGVQVNQAGGGFDFASLTTQNIERVEIVRGPSSALYGSDAVTGVIHVITRMGRGAPEGTVRVETGSYGEREGLVDGTRWTADLAGGSERARYTVAVGRDAADGVFPYNSRHESLALSGAARFLPDERTRVALTLRLQDREYHYPTDAAGAVVDRNAFFFSDETIANLSIARALTGALEVEAVVGLSETDGGTDDAPDDPADTDSYRSLDHFRRASAQLRSHLRMGPAVLTAGAELEEERQRSFSEGTSSFGPPFYGRSEDQRANVAGFAHATTETGPFSLGVGGRLEDNERFGRIGSWQVGVAVHLPDRPSTRLRASAGSAIKEPTFAENFATGFAVGNPDLDPEWSLSWEVGAEHALWNGALTAGATYFQQRFEEMIQYTFLAPPDEPNYFNIAAARARGVELDAAARAGPVDASASWTWLDTEVEDAGFDVGAGATFVEGQPLIRRPEHTLAVSASAPVGGRARVHTRVTFVGARQDRDFTTFPATPVELERYALWTLGGEWLVQPPGSGLPRVSLSLRAENLLDERYEEAFAFPAPGRQLYVGMSVGFGGAP